jgi:hypothetical protein
VVVLFETGWVPGMNDAREVIKERGTVYGPTWMLTSKVVALLQALGHMNAILQDGVVFHNWFMILGKLMRLLASPRHIDSWVDIAGYAQLVIDYETKGEDNG